MEWISVEDRLPEEGVTVLGWGRSRTILNTLTRPYRMIIRYKTEDDSERIYSGWVFTRDGLLAENVTHWMPLPAPPEE